MIWNLDLCTASLLHMYMYICARLKPKALYRILVHKINLLATDWGCSCRGWKHLVLLNSTNLIWNLDLCTASLPYYMYMCKTELQHTISVE